MKITRFARGYRMRLTEGEMAALNTALAALANRLDKGSLDALCGACGRRVKTPLRRFVEGRGLRVDEDLRPVMKKPGRLISESAPISQATWDDLKADPEP
jgi:hypothetical protein